MASDTTSDRLVSRPLSGRRFRPVPGWTVLALAGLAGGVGACGGEETADPPAAATEAGARAVEAGPVPPAASMDPTGPVTSDLPPAPDTQGPIQESERDWAIARGTLEWAWEQQLQTLPVGEVMAILGATFVGTPYVPGTLELEGPERLAVNLRAFDCVTFVEHILVLSRLTLGSDPELLANEDGFRERYRRELTRVRYRDGVLDGYPSRLHYFSEWIRDAREKGLVRDVTVELGGVEDTRPIDFMSSNPEAYRQLAEDTLLVSAIRETEARLNAIPRFFIPEAEIASHEQGIENGDVIAAVSSVDGLDVAHTGIAIWRGGRLHLMHAPLVGDSVQISERPLSERILDIGGQTGIIVARPLPPG